MPWSRGHELYLPDASTLAGIALDYDVVPLARATFARVEYVFDGVARAPVVVPGDCPSTLSSSAWTSEAVSDEVVFARVQLGAPNQPSRFGWISYPVGSHSLTLDTTAVPPSERTGSFFAVFAPSLGRSRIAVRAITLTPASGNSISVPGLPDAAGHIALIRTPLVQPLEGGPALQTFAGFSVLWAPSAEVWYGALVPAGQSTPVSLVRYRGATEGAGRASLHADDVLPPDAAPLPFTANTQVRIISYGPRVTGGEVTIACDGSTSITTPFQADLTITLDGSTLAVAAGALQMLDPNCAGAGLTETAHVRVESQTHSGFVVVRNP